MGSKLDLAEEEGQRKVSYKEGMDFAEKNGMGFIEVSSKDGTKVEECFQEMISRVYHFSLNGNLREDMKEACRMGRSDTAGDIVVSFPEVIHQRDEVFLFFFLFGCVFCFFLLFFSYSIVEWKNPLTSCV